MSRAYYNEIDAFAAQWLRNLIAEGHIAPGDVDERSIEDVRPTDLVGYTQCHFFAGIGVWSSALRGAGWPDDRPVWTGSCPCQPFSQAGKGAGVADERHLWPAWFHLIQHAKGRDVPVYGEQVANGDGLTWLDIVQADLEGAGYTFGAVDLCAAGFGAPHIRQRLFFYAERMGDTNAAERYGQGSANGSPGREGPANDAIVCRLAHAECGTAERQRFDLAGSTLGAEVEAQQRERLRDDAGHGGIVGRVADSGHSQHQRRDAVLGTVGEYDGAPGADQGSGESRDVQGWQWSRNDITIRGAVGPVNGFWRGAEWIPCRSAKVPGAIDWRAIEPGTFPLVNGAPGRVGRLRANGNAINREVAIGFIVATMDEPARVAQGIKAVARSEARTTP